MLAFRSFCAHLLANGGSQKPIAKVVSVPVPGKAQKKPKTQTVLTISPDEDDKDKHLRQGSLTNKKAKTLSSILTTQNMMVLQLLRIPLHFSWSFFLPCFFFFFLAVF